MIHNISEEGATRLVGTKDVPVNLFNHYGTVTLGQVQKNTRWIKEYGDDQSETLTHCLVVNERLMGMDEFEGVLPTSKLLCSVSRR